MHNYFTDNLKGDIFELSEKNYHHLKNVIKININEKIVCVYNSNKYLCKIVEISNEIYYAKIEKKLEFEESYIEINLIVGIIREQKWDFILQKATELGVTKIVPVEFKRNVVKIDFKKEENKISRWTNICKSSAEQSKRNFVPIIEPVIRNLNELVKYKADLNLVCWEEEKKLTFKKELKNKFSSISIVIGPEGGIERDELDLLKKIGYKSITLGENIMRAETVPLFIISCIKYEKS
ncbi:RsmE family RNA methyltransferase [Spiroplasma taiwanense]|uniref:Ribosomal RNA small subunit methyltransferase E n=1 Tax=Spiroplasma taiwanense CT-1 TaxID=1276220 RepID=S5LWM0_9MOLU|nr:16S rRNA (uracil(1498)-N(3))-methyltransferase [Spiroplasma taiwanense]AGR41031.1 16S ribosomal RNA methyltransferase RsmE [Spiroplasma taiwanense CT-1]